MAVANAMAPEHLELMVAEPGELVPLVRHAGAVFFGASRAGVVRRLPGRPQPRAADEPDGPLRLGALRVEDFRKHSTPSPSARRRRALWPRRRPRSPTTEGLPAHAESVRLRAGRPTWSDR